MKHKVSELEGTMLDAAVAKAEGILVTPADDHPSQPGYYQKTRGELGCHIVRWYGGDGEEGGWAPITSWGSPSTEWEDGGPIIERERIQLGSFVNGDWEAFALAADRAVERLTSKTAGKMRGQTPLIAAMRAYVASKFGEEVELPEAR